MSEPESDKSRVKPLCTFCKKRKIKCDRNDPCASCVRFDNPDCVYVDPGPKVKKQRNRSSRQSMLVEEIDLLKLKINSLERNYPENGPLSNGSGPGSNGSSTGSGSGPSPNSRKRPAQDILGPVNDDLSNGFSPRNAGILNIPFKSRGPYSTVFDMDVKDLPFDDNVKFILGFIKKNGIDERFNLYDGPAPVVDAEPVRRRNFGILSWKGCMTLDNCLQVLFSHAKLIMIRQGSFYNIHSDEFDKKVAKRYQDRLVESVEPFPSANGEGAKSLSSEESPSLATPTSDPQNWDYKDSISDYKPIKMLHNLQPTLQTGISRNGEVPENLTQNSQVLLKNRIQAFLPKRRIIWRLVEQFFRKLYDSMPVLDEQNFKDHIIKLIEDKNQDERCEDLKITNKLDFAHLGILLLICRISYLSVLPKKSAEPGVPNEKRASAEEQELAKLFISNPINLDAVSLAQDCLNLFNLFGTINLTIFQLAVIDRAYLALAPECGDGPDHGDAQVLTSILFQMAYSLGLNRDPDKISALIDGRLKNLMRKMWYTLLIMDLSQSLQFGDPLNVSKYSFDTKLPIFDPKHSNLCDIKQEEFMVECFQFLDDAYKPIAFFLTQMTDMNSEFTVTKLCQHVQFLRVKLFNGTSVLESYLANASKPPDQRKPLNLLRYKVEVEMGHFICSLYFRLFNYFESKSQYDLSYFYLLRVLEKVLLTLVPFYLELTNLDNTEPSLHFVLVPGIQIMLHKGILFLLSIITRVKIVVITMFKNPNHLLQILADKEYATKFVKLVTMLKQLVDVTSGLIAIPTSYSRRYYYSWIISRMAKHFLSITKSEDFRNEVAQIDFKLPVLEKIENIDKLLAILELCVDAKQKLSMMRGIPIPEEPQEVCKNNTGVDNLMKSVNTARQSIDTPAPSQNQQKNQNEEFQFTESIGQLFSPESKNGDSLGSTDEVDALWLQLLKNPNVAQEGIDSFKFDIPQSYDQFPDMNPSSVSEIGTTPNLMFPDLGDVGTPGVNMTNGNMANGAGSPYGYGAKNGTPTVNQFVMDEILKQFS